MILQSTRISRKGGIRYLAHHLLDKLEENELIEVLAGDRQALADAQALAQVKRCRYSVRHLSISPERDMSPAQLSDFLRMVDVEFGIGQNRPRLVVRHIKHGRPHFHIAISEVDPRSLRVLDCRNDYRRLEDLARRYEQAHGENVQPTRAERRRQRVEGFSNIARKRAERRAEDFDRTALRKSFADGSAAFRAELYRQGLRLAEGEKGAILVALESDTFVAAACRAVGVKRAEFQRIMKEEIPNEQQSRNPSRVPEHDHSNGAQHGTAPAASRVAGGPRRARQDCAASRLARPDSRCPEPAGNRPQKPRGKNRTPAASIARMREALALHRLTKLDLDDLLRRAMELAASIMTMFAPERDRLAWRIAEAKLKQTSTLPAESIEGQRLTYDLRRRMTP
ncbi:relaxase/mobilization nuclease domain-containing protein [Agrobacterium pusense]|uniref:relaxase/mobilization nuclease domain-containing protein n=1 Tax=Agrobacterium pusense TaxID=648995 RepID=UPI0028A0767B|nr:relaxase/mobilization nuclease domain-containing protein [Agrobacterium pusense]